MPTAFAAMQDRALLAIERTRGEGFTIKPQAVPAGDVNARPTADAARPEATFTGVFTDPSADLYGNSPGHASNRSPMTSMGRAHIAFRAANLPYAVRQHDLVTRVDTGERFVVADTGSDGLGRSILSLTARRS